MTTKIFSFLLLATLFFVSCKSTESGTKNTTVKTSETKIPYTLANRYFVKNTFDKKDLKSPKITSQDEFDNIFGMATVMGKDGTPTEIDFSKQFVIAVIADETDKATTLTVNSLTEKDNVITLDYNLNVGAKQSYTMQPVLLLIVDSKYKGEVKVFGSIKQ